LVFVTIKKIDSAMVNFKALCIHTWMGIEFMASTRLICNMIFWGVALATLDAHGAFQNNAQGVVTTAVMEKQGAKLTKDHTPITESNVLKETAKLLPRLAKSETKHYVILSDTSPEDVTMVGTLLEVAFQKYLDVCDALGWQPRPLRHKLVAVVFREQTDYLDFAIKNDKVTKTWAVGYYSPFFDRLVFYKSESGADVQKVVQQLNAQDRKVQQAEQMQQAAGRALRPNSQLTHAKNQLAAEHDRINDLAAGSFVSTAVHEAAHQLFFHTDIQRNGSAYPLWLAEGLATNFETERTDIQFGYQVDNWRRRDAFKLAWEKDGLVPLEIMLTQERFSDGTNSAEAIADFYAQSYVFTNWLMRERPTELRLYLESLLDGSFAIADQRKIKFENIFGPIGRLERSWARYEGQRNKEFLSCPNCKRVLAKLPKTSKPTPDLTAKPAGSQENVPGNATVPVNPVAPVASKPPTQPETQSTPVPPK
jgi:hypothetical protein